MRKEILEISVRGGFTCLGSECPCDCCHGWDRIEVDAKTREKWEAEQDSQVKEQLLGFIDYTDKDVPVMKKTNEKVCLALNDNKLCNIQLQYGHDYLSEICQSFPRIDFDNTYRRYDSASFSCPEIVRRVLFDKTASSLYITKYQDDQENKTSSGSDELLYALDSMLGDILDLSDYKIGVELFFIADIFTDILKEVQFGGVGANDIIDIRANISTYLKDITGAVKQGGIKPNPVTSGSFWKTIYDYCQKRDINKLFFEGESSALARSITRCDGSFSGFSKIYSVIKKYKKKANKQMKQQYVSLLRQYVKVVFINKGFPLAPKHSLDFVLVECMINISVLQLLIWIEVNKNGKLTDEFLEKCIVEVDRKFVLADGVIKALEEESHMIQVDKYCNAFLDIF